ncbi:MAG: hypothetical protein ABIK79_16785 [Chloroflexota bacterium]
MDVRFHTGIAEQRACLEVVGALHDNPNVANDLFHVVGVDVDHERLYPHLRADFAQLLRAAATALGTSSSPKRTCLSRLLSST